MKRKKFFVSLFVILALIAGLALTGCLDSGDDESGSGGNPFLGTWMGYIVGYRVRVVIDQSTWTMAYLDYPSLGYQTGTYTYSGNKATFYQNGYAFGTATVSGNTLTGTNPEIDGTYTLTRQL